jgi:two-component system sensor kinase FixL
MPTSRLKPGETRGILEAIFQSAVDGIIVIDTSGRIEAYNPAAERMFGYTAQEVLGQNVNMLMPSPYREEHDGYVARYLGTGEKRIIGIGREVTGRRKDGTTFPVHLAVGEMHVEGEWKFTGILHDLTARVRIEQQMREQSALTRLGEMAAVVAHEVKNPLAGIRGAIQVIGGRLPADSKDAAIAKEVVSRIDALNDLMKDLLLFARPPQPHMSVIDPLSLSRTVVELMRGDPALHTLAVDVTGDSVAVTADGELLKIVIQNLLLNAAHALQGRGRIEVTVRAADGRCRIDVTDNGPGIPPHVREKLFTPFFTTKARGTGLGLSTARRLLEAHRGTIAVECPPGGGTTVTLDLPASHVA